MPICETYLKVIVSVETVREWSSNVGSVGNDHFQVDLAVRVYGHVETSWEGDRFVRATGPC